MEPDIPTQQPLERLPEPPRPEPFRTMHDEAETWTDTCSCEPEPRWQLLGEELDALVRPLDDTGSDHPNASRA